jgi:hypothetical protein
MSKSFSDAAGGHVLIASEARYLSGLLWRAAPLESLKLLLRARRSGALSTRQIAMLFGRNGCHTMFTIRSDTGSPSQDIEG